MKREQPQFDWNSTDRIGVFSLLIIISLFLISIYSINSRPAITSDLKIDEKAEERWTEIVDSLKNQQNQKKSFKIYPFNPNFISDYKAYTLNMPTEAFDRLKTYRSKGQWINSNREFQDVTKVSDQWMKTYAQYFKFPQWVIDQQNAIQPELPELSYQQKKDLNSVSKEELQKISGIGEVLANRIINYRTKLGGFRNTIQIKDIYGLNYEVEKRLLQQMTVKTSTEYKLININTASVVELQQIPYFNYELARQIFSFIKLREGVSSLEELSKIETFPSHRIPQLKLYLKIN